ncbi:MAG: nickel-dependent hydrogenase large subunit [Pseudomonadota bacterium]
MTRLVVGPFNRVEGDLEVHLDIEGGAVRAAYVNSPMYRGFENMLAGRDPHDALVVVPRICGICSVSQSMAAARALQALGLPAPPPAGQHLLNLMLAVENVADHLTHFYLFFMPDFVRDVYRGRLWFDETARRFAAQRGEHAREAIAARARWFTILGTLGGKWPHTQSVLPSGSARAIDASEQLRLAARVREFRAFLERTLYGASLERIATLATRAQLDAYANDAAGGDLRLFLAIARDAQLESLGRGPGRYLSYGAYARIDGRFTFAPGVWDGGISSPVDLRAITEDVTSSWYAPAPPVHPSLGVTLPQAERIDAYSWNKAPRYAGRVLETGALARQMLDGQPLIRAEEARCGGNVYTRVLARLIELARIVLAIEGWVPAIEPGAPCFSDGALPHEGDAAGITEAARGSLAHWISVRNGKIANYQIVAPTTWNFSPRDAEGQPGALEGALVGAPVLPGEKTPVAVQHVVRSFDPCMVCTVH